MRTVKILAGGGGGIIGLFVAGLLAVWLLVNPNDYKGRIAAAVKESTGRELVLKGDIKKSIASPPAVIRDRLRGLVPTLVRPGQEANRYRGRIAQQKGIQTIWRRIVDRDGIRYELDRDHPVIAGLRATVDDGSLPELDNVLRAARALARRLAEVCSAPGDAGLTPGFRALPCEQGRIHLRG